MAALLEFPFNPCPLGKDPGAVALDEEKRAYEWLGG